MTFSQRASRLLLALAAALLVVVLVVRDGGDSDPLRNHFTPHRPIVLTILHWGENDETAINDQLVARYESLHPDVQIINISASDYDPKLNTMFAAATRRTCFLYEAPGAGGGA